MTQNVKIPVAFQIRLDDVAWHIGHDDRYCGHPSRTGIPRLHSVLDYPIIHELGKALGVKINCALVLGEWDKENILRGQNSLSWDPDGWNRAAEIDMDYAEKAFEALESSDYIDYTLHGVLHGHYDRGVQLTEQEFYTRVYDHEKGCYTKEITWQTEDSVRLHLDYFFKLYNMWGFKKPIHCFACGNGSYGGPSDEGNIMYAGIFREYGLDVWKNSWRGMADGNCAVINGMIALKGANGKSGGSIPWNAFDVDPDYLGLFNTEENAFTDYGIHWPNLLRWNPEKNLEYLPKWINYFNKQAEVFGTMMAKDVLFAASQAVYNRYAKVDFMDGKYIIDLADVDKQNARALKNEFYVSFKSRELPTACVGGVISLYETKKNFVTYKIERNGANTVTVQF